SLLGFNGSAASSSVGNTTPRTSSASYSSLASLSSSGDFETGSTHTASSSTYLEPADRRDPVSPLTRSKRSCGGHRQTTESDPEADMERASLERWILASALVKLSSPGASLFPVGQRRSSAFRKATCGSRTSTSPAQRGPGWCCRNFRWKEDASAGRCAIG